jgi:argininosuccinate lyase
VIAAHVAMLRDVGLIDDESADSLLDVIERVSEQAGTGATDPTEIVREFDGRIEAQAPAAVASVGLVARGVIDVAATVARLELRSDLLDLDAELERLRAVLIDLAGAQAVSVMPILIDGAVAQPGTIAHWLAGLIAPLGRAHVGLVMAHESVNQSPLGAGSHASSGLENDRVATAEALGFEAAIPSAFDAVTAVDQFADSADAAAAIASSVGRWLNELIVLARTEPSSLRLADHWRSTLEDMPQFDAPTGIEALAARGEAAFAQARSVAAAAMRAPYSPVSARLTGLLSLTSQALAEVRAVVAETRDLLADGLEFNRAYLANRAGRAFSTASDLIDFLMIEEQQDPQAARAIAALTISRARELGVEASGITPELIDGAALLVIGQELKVEFEAISRYLAPRRFIERRTAVGGPSPSSIRTYISVERAKLDEDSAWRQATAGEIERLARNG